MFRGKLHMIFGVLAILTGETLLAQSHNYVNIRRSGVRTYVNVSQSLEGEYGRMTIKGTEDKTTGRDAVERQTWQGFGIGTTIGMEILKFVQFNAGHQYVNMSSRGDGMQKLTGSRFHGGGRLVFAAPVVNLELGAGVSGTRFDYQRSLENASLYGSGMYYSLGLNYFMSDQISVFTIAKQSTENNVRSGGSTNVDSIRSETTLLGLGFSLWI